MKQMEVCGAVRCDNEADGSVRCGAMRCSASV